MLFPTTDFAVFFVVVFTASWLLRPYPRAWKWMILLASYVFYGWWDWRFVALLAASTVITQSGAQAAARSRPGKAALAVTVGLQLGLLGWFKYYGFFTVNVANALHRAGLGSPLPVVQVALPIGISFFTFMGISYVVDCHRGQLQPAGWLDAAVYLAFFPHLVAGPIVRGSELLPQLRPRALATADRRIDASRAAWLIMAGLAKKVVISSFLARVIVDPVFALPGHHSALEVLVAIYAYAVQIYADFSGYTDIAIGVALLLGFHFPENFDSPYAAVSMQDFWRRWHITLSRWLRDYLYIPLGGNRGGRWATVRNIMITMAIGGLWHGAAWTFVLWGAFHGAAQSVGLLRRRYAGATRRDPGTTDPSTSTGAVAVLDRVTVVARPRSSPWMARLVTFHLVCLGWVLFRAESIRSAVGLLSRLAHPGPSPLVTPLVVLAIAVSLASQYVPRDAVSRLQARFSALGVAAQGAILAGGLFTITLLGPTGVAPFIYYRF